MSDTKKKLPRGVFERDGCYWIRYADSAGAIHREKVGALVGVAKAAYQQRKTAVRTGTYFPKSKIVLYSEIVADHLEFSRTAKLRDHVRTEYKAAVLLDLWKDVPIAELTAGRLERDLAALALRKGWKPATHNRYRALLSKQFSVALKNEKLKTNNPARSVTHRQENNERVRWLTDDEELRLIEAVRSLAPALELKILVALYSGMRRSEQFRTPDCLGSGLKWSYIDLPASTITLPRSKSGLSRRIPIGPVLREALVKLRQVVGSVYVFPPGAPDRLFPRIVRFAKIKNFRWHDLRHAFASRLVMDNTDIRTVQEIMGHRSIVTTMRYAHLAERHLQDAVDKLKRPVPQSELSKLAL